MRNQEGSVCFRDNVQHSGGVLTFAARAHGQLLNGLFELCVIGDCLVGACFDVCITIAHDWSFSVAFFPFIGGF